MVQKPKNIQSSTVERCLSWAQLSVLGILPLPSPSVTSVLGFLCFHPYIFKAYTNKYKKSYFFSHFYPKSGIIYVLFAFYSPHLGFLGSLPMSVDSLITFFFFSNCLVSHYMTMQSFN